MITFWTHEYPRELPENSIYLCTCEDTCENGRYHDHEFTYFKDPKDIMNEIPFEKMDNIYYSEIASYHEVIKADGELIWYTLLLCKSYMNLSKLFEYIILKFTNY